MEKNVRLSHGEFELIVTNEVDPRIICFGFIDDVNIFAEIDEQQGVAGEDEWMSRGGHNFWLALEEKPLSYELDNSTESVTYSEIGMNLKTFTNEKILKIKSLGEITRSAPDESVSHQKIRQLRQGVSPCVT